MSKIVLISCSSMKSENKSKAQDMYISPLFKLSLQYARSICADKIFILSAKYHLLELDDVIEPYNVTLCRVSSSKAANSNLKVLSKYEINYWARTVAEMLQQKSNLLEDNYIYLAGQSYIKPLTKWIDKKNIINELKGLKQGQRLKFLKERIK